MTVIIGEECDLTRRDNMRYKRAKKDEKEVVHRRDGARYPTGRLRIVMRLNRLPEYESAGSARGCYTYSWRMGPGITSHSERLGFICPALGRRIDYSLTDLTTLFLAPACRVRHG